MRLFYAGKTSAAHVAMRAREYFMPTGGSLREDSERIRKKRTLNPTRQTDSTAIDPLGQECQSAFVLLTFQLSPIYSPINLLCFMGLYFNSIAL